MNKYKDRTLELRLGFNYYSCNRATDPINIFLLAPAIAHIIQVKEGKPLPAYGDQLLAAPIGAILGAALMCIVGIFYEC